MEESTNKPVQNDFNVLTSSVSFTDSPKKCNLSFSINFDFNDVNSENSTDSENADLQIDISEVDNYEPSSKHKREAVEEASVLNEMEEEIERQLDAKAAKTNLTATNVKNILKHVIPYEHLMTMVQKWLQDTENDINIGPKLTRAKAKKLAAAKVDILWPITTAQKTSSEVQALIQEELPEDSSDEEYNPEHDKQSDDDREVEIIGSNDIESQLSISTNSKDIASQQQMSSHILYDSEGIFKIPAVPPITTEEESIGQRTRSKLSLSETSLEEIEQAFIPPDITADMTDDWDCELDEDWDNFLKEFTQPLTQEPAIEDDPDADPEYNILEDETDLWDKEELRTDRAVEVPRKEQYDLIAELLELTPMFSTQEQEVSRKKKVLDNTTPPIENDAMNSSVAHLLPVLAESELPKLMDYERLLLATQFQQHIQLMAQHFVMTYMHPEYHLLAKVCKQNLNSLRYLNNGPKSAFNVKNLEAALKLVSTWENKFNDTKFYANFKKNVTNETAKSKIYCVNKYKYIEQFLPELEKLFVESKALMYPHLLPSIPFRNGVKYKKPAYSKAEETLIALGIEQFLPFVSSKSKKFHTKKMQLFDAVQLIIHYLLPCRDAQGLLHHIYKRRASKDENPIKHYFEKSCAPKIVHYVTSEFPLKAPKDQSIELLPLKWQTYLQKEHKNDLAKSRYIFDSYSNLSLAKEGINMNAIMKSFYPSIPNNHLLRNPIVNMLPKILPATLNPKAPSKIDNSTKKSCKFNSEDKKIVDNSIQNTETYKRKTAVHKGHTNSCSSKANTSDVEPIQTDKSLNKNNIKLNTVLTRSSKMSKESPQISPQIRKTTPRLAKTKSAQNMKLMAQALGSKNSFNCNTLKSKEKDAADKNIDEHCSTSKVDNEEEIAELMLASSTIIKDSVSRKKAKQTRELEIIKRLLKAENPLTEEEREAKFAASYLQKLHLILESNDPETFKAVIKLFLDYSEKLDSINHTVTDPSIIDGSEDFPTNKQIEDNAIKKDILTIQLYQEICKKLQNYPEVFTDFVLFLKPHQAAIIGKSAEYMMLQKMNDFVHVAQIYFAKQPSRIAKMMQAITQLSSDPHTTLENVYAVMNTVFKGHPLVMDLFLQILPTAKPPESLFAPHMFENMTCPLGPYDKNITYMENASELYENIELPTATYQEDPYGGENCKCDCHNIDEASSKNNSEHCVSCGIRFLNGRIYLQTPEGLRPAKITFAGEDREKLENIARISLKIADKAIPSISSKKRKSSKNNSNHEDLCKKQCATKYSPIKDNEDNEKAITKSKRNVKFTLKTDQRKILKRIGTVDHAVADKRMRISQCKNKREKKIEESDVLLEQNEPDITRHEKANEFTETENSCCTQLSMQDNLSSTEVIAKTQISSNISNNIGFNSNKNIETVLTTATENMSSKSDLTNDKPWTRQEDMILLQNIKKEYSESSFLLISEKLENRTVDQVKERCQTLLSLLQKMM
ncbi:GON-4-like protein [Trachymyrmex septentrionalis]|uniref:GON-4-like protein n=1 Tax=Trachymyrmex septentrionalis TaxID=34720 RepID=A0A151K0K4_9HYME|nr:PREDICTED: GON-4-like protein isoform X2 [Trachymyrmex septentrionalis]KYN43105.1 GON-4-like protein [Trachymyrmex septentrionalis]